MLGYRKKQQQHISTRAATSHQKAGKGYVLGVTCMQMVNVDGGMERDVVRQH